MGFIFKQREIRNLREVFMFFQNYNKDEKLEFNYKRACGLWLIVVAVIISLATLTGGKQIINMQVFCIPKLQYQFVHFLSFLPKYQNLT